MGQLSSADQQLATLLVQYDVMSESALQRVLEQHALIGGRFADYLIDTNVVPEARLLRLLEQYEGLGLVNFKTLEYIDPVITQIIPASLAQSQMAVPFRVDGQRLYVAFLDVPDIDALASMKGFADYQILIYLAPRDVMRWAVARHYPELGLIAADPKTLTDPFENRIGNRLIAQGVLTPEQLEDALLERTPGKAGRTGEVLLRLGYITEADLYRALAAQNNLPFVAIPEEWKIPEDVALLLSRVEAERWQVVPMLSDDTSVTLVTTEPKIFTELQPLFARGIKLMMCTPTQLKILIQQLETINEPLLQNLLQQGVLNFEQRNEVLSLSRRGRGTIEEVLVQQGFVSGSDISETTQQIETNASNQDPEPTTFSERLARGLAEQLGYAFVNPITDPPDLSLVKLIPEKVMRQYSLFPNRRETDGISVLMTDPRNFFALDDLQLLLGQRIRPVVADRLEIERLIDQQFRPTPVTPEPKPEVQVQKISEEAAAEPAEVALLRQLIREELETFRLQLLHELKAN